MCRCMLCKYINGTVSTKRYITYLQIAQKKLKRKIQSMTAKGYKHNGLTDPDDNNSELSACIYTFNENRWEIKHIRESK